MILTGETKKAARRFSAIEADWETAAACVKMETELSVLIRPLIATPTKGLAAAEPRRMFCSCRQLRRAGSTPTMSYSLSSRARRPGHTYPPGSSLACDLYASCSSRTPNAARIQCRRMRERLR